MGSAINTLSNAQQKFEAQNIQVNLDKRGELIKVYCNNIFIGIALVEKSKGEMQLPEHVKDSIKILTSNSESELTEAFKSVIALDKDKRTEAIDQKFATVMLFIEQFSGGRLREHITSCDVDNLLSRIQTLEKLSPSPEVAARLANFREIITAFKIDNVLSSKPILERNNAYNMQYYKDTYNVDITKRSAA